MSAPAATKIVLFCGGRGSATIIRALLRQTDIEGAMWAVAGVPNLWVLPSGPAPANPGDLLWPADGRTGTLTVPEVIAQLMDAGYTVIVDSPPVMPVADAVTLSRTVEGTIFVANAGTTRARTLQRSLEQLDRADARVVGMVLNRSAEAMTIFAVICAATFPGIHIGRQWMAWFLPPLVRRMRAVAGA